MRYIKSHESTLPFIREAIALILNVRWNHDQTKQFVCIYFAKAERVRVISTLCLKLRTNMDEACNKDK